VAAEPITDVDTTAADMLAELDRALNAQGVHLVFAEMKDPVRRKIERYELTRTIDPAHFYPRSMRPSPPTRPSPAPTGRPGDPASGRRGISSVQEDVRRSGACDTRGRRRRSAPSEPAGTSAFRKERPMASIFKRVKDFAQSPKGEQAKQEIKEQASKPENRRKLKEFGQRYIKRR